MKSKFLTTGIFLIAAFSSNAYALQIAGWGFSTGSVDVRIDLKGVPNPTTQPTVAVVDAALDQVEYLCYNPVNFNVAPGEAGLRTVEVNQQVAPENITSNGKATVLISFEIPGPFPCVNPNWTYIENSAAAKQISTTISYYYCNGTDPVNPCYTDNTLTVSDKKAGSVQGVCTLDPVLRDDTYHYVLPKQTYTCTQTSP